MDNIKSHGALDPYLVPGTLVNDRVAAAALAVGRTKFWSLVKEGKLTPVRMGSKCTRFRTDELFLIING